MGIDLHTLAFLTRVAKENGFGDTLTLGRQEIHLPNYISRQLSLPLGQGLFAENLLVTKFGSHRVDSLDRSNYEGATIQHDLNFPVPDALKARYDTLIDAGTVEHVFDVRVALQNCFDLVREGGQLLHILPANNYCGHGFFQFSPELFLSLYSKQNGFEDTQVYLARHSDNNSHFLVKHPERGQRINIYSSERIYMMIRAVKGKNVIFPSRIQQSDYEHLWKTKNEKILKKGRDSIKDFIARIPVFRKLLSPITKRIRNELELKRNGVTSWNSKLEKIRIEI